MSEMKNLFDLGSLVSLAISSWSGRKMINKSDLISMGIDPSNLPTDLVNYGRKLLISRSELQLMSRIEQKARKYLYTYSVPFGVVNAGFVANKNLANVEATLKEHQKDYFKAVDKFIERFEEAKKEVKNKHPDFFEKCLKKYYPANPEQLRSNFSFRWSIFRIAAPESFKEGTVEDVLASEEIKNEKKQTLRNKMNQEVQSFVQEYVNTMRNETIKFCDLMSCRVQGKPYGDESDAKQLTGRSLAFFRKHVDRFKQMNCFNDNEIEKMLSSFKDQFLESTLTPKHFENESVKMAVGTALAKIREAASREGEQTSEFINSLKRKIVI